MCPPDQFVVASFRAASHALSSRAKNSKGSSAGPRVMARKASGAVADTRLYTVHVDKFSSETYWPVIVGVKHGLRDWGGAVRSAQRNEEHAVVKACVLEPRQSRYRYPTLPYHRRS